jgi:hypothetical protein
MGVTKKRDAGFANQFPDFVNSVIAAVGALF